MAMRNKQASELTSGNMINTQIASNIAPEVKLALFTRKIVPGCGVNLVR